MPVMSQPRTRKNQALRFGPYELDAPAGELRKHGLRIKLQRQPVQVLLYLAQRAGQVVTREELQAALWPTGTYVDFEHGLNRSINKVRAALSDDSANPRYVETISGHGYRFVAEVRAADQGQISVAELAIDKVQARPALPGPAQPRKPFPAKSKYWIAAGLIVAALAARDLWKRTEPLAMPVLPMHVAAQLFGKNLVVNAGAEDGPASNGYAPVKNIPGWTRTDGNFTVESYGGPDGLPSKDSPGPLSRGKKFFSGGQDSPYSRAIQNLDLTFAATGIDAGQLRYALSGFLGGYEVQDDSATLRAIFKDANGKVLGTSAIGPVLAKDRQDVTELLERHTSGVVPPGTRTATLELFMNRVDSHYNDGYADNLSLVLNSN